MSWLLTLGAGWLTWTMLEYGFHRVGGHVLGKRVEFGRQHLRHHREQLWFATAADKARLAVVVSGVLFLITWPLIGWAHAALFTATVVSSYLGYEWLHQELHLVAPRTAYGRWARKHHLIHHHVDPNMNHGVTTPLWDWVFGTLRVEPTVRIVGAKAPPWLGTPGDEPWRPDYRVVGRIKA